MDLIKRQDAQMAVQDHYNKDHGFRSYEDGQRMLNRINALPLVQKTGKWIREVLGSTSGYGTTVMYQCTNCEKMSISKYKFCPNCGASMRGGYTNENISDS